MEQVRCNQPARRRPCRECSYTASQCWPCLFTNCVFSSHNSQINFGETKYISLNLSLSSIPITMLTLHVVLLTGGFIERGYGHKPAIQIFPCPRTTPKFRLCIPPSPHLFNNYLVLFYFSVHVQLASPLTSARESV